MYAIATIPNKRSSIPSPIVRDALSFCAQIALVVGIELSDDLAHGLIAQNDVHTAQANALSVMHFEAAHGFWLEPGIQSFFERTHHLLGLTIGWAQVVPIVNALYGLGHVFFTLAFALWIYCCRRPLFSFLRNVFLLTNALALALYETFPLAPPRLASGLRYDGHPYHFVDTVFAVGSGMKLSFNELAAMPSLHVGWALLVGLTLVCTVRSRAVRLLALVYPLIMLTTVIVTGNHYISDGLGALAVLMLAFTLSIAFEWWRSADESLGQVVRRLHSLCRSPRHDSAAPEAAAITMVPHREAA
jgi:hypothetical protein